MKTTLSFKIEKGIFYFMMLFSSMFFIIIAPGVINYVEIHRHVLSPFVGLGLMLIGFFLIIYFRNKKAPEDIDKQKITPYDYIEDRKQELLELFWHIFDEQIEDIKTLYNDSLKITREIGSFFVNFSKLLRNDSLILKKERRCKLQKEKEDEESLTLSNEYHHLLFSKVGTPIEVEQIIWAHLVNFIKYRTVPTDKDLHIPYNKNLRNIELTNYIKDIVEMNHLEHLNYELFLKTVFYKWFSGDMTNIASNANRRVKNPLVKNEGWEINLKRLRDPSFKGVK